MPMETIHVDRLIESRENLLHAAALLQEVIDKKSTQTAICPDLGMAPQTLNHQLVDRFVPYIRTRMLAIDDLPKLINRHRSPGDKLILDVLYGTMTDSDELIVLPEYDGEHLWDVVYNRLTPREYAVAAMRSGYSTGESMELIDVARELCVTKERVRQIYEKALRKLRHPGTVAQIFRDLTPIADKYEELARDSAEAQRKRLVRADADFKKAASMSELADVLLEAERKLAAGQDDEAANILAARTRDEIRNGETPVVTLEDAEPSVRTYNCLARAGIKTLNELAVMDADEIFRIRNLGRRSMHEIHTLLLRHLNIDRQDIASMTLGPY